MSNPELDATAVSLSGRSPGLKQLSLNGMRTINMDLIIMQWELERATLTSITFTQAILLNILGVNTFEG